MTRFALSAMALGWFAASPASAEVVSSTDTAFVIQLAAEVPATPEDSWKALIIPASWWSGEHTYSGDPANLYIDSQATGCFCEKLPKPADAPPEQRMGSVEHMHIVYSQPNKALRMVGALGPLQSEAVNGTLTITLKPVKGGTRILWEYMVGGFMRFKTDRIAPMVDKVLGEQFDRLADKLGRVAIKESEAIVLPDAASSVAPAAEGEKP